MSAWFGRVGSPDALPEKMPAIWLVTDPSCPESRARFVADGCEEEGIPLAWDLKDGSAEELAHFASLRSQLEVGIGLGADGLGAIAVVAVADRPYISRAAVTERPLRWLGQAAARISKSQPIPSDITVSVPSRAPVAEESVEVAGDVESLVRLIGEALMRLQEGVDEHERR
jgi:hypothetical protein